jgi:hypothetical protein
MKCLGLRQASARPAARVVNARAATPSPKGQAGTRGPLGTVQRGAAGAEARLPVFWAFFAIRKIRFPSFSRPPRPVEFIPATFFAFGEIMDLKPKKPDPRASRADLQDRQADHRPAVSHLLAHAAQMLRASAGPAPAKGEDQK